jgi:release factor glutamine methyltransferase
MSSTRKEWTVISMLEWATSYFEEKGVKSPRLSIEWLLAFVLDIKRLDLYIKYDRPLSEDELNILRPFVKRRANHEPLQYITGEASFYNATLKVNPSVLIPRQETEQLVEIICTEQADKKDLTILDVGTGSGCIPVALKKEHETWNVFACDISSEALSLAKENAVSNNVEIEYIIHDLFDARLKDQERKFDLIISNPPYILENEEENLDREVKSFEPHLALFCESTQKMYSAIEEFCSQNLSKEGTLYLELHENYANEVKAIFSEKKWKAKLVKDLENKSRFLVATRE